MESRHLSPIDGCASPEGFEICECFVSASLIEKIKRYYPPRCLHELARLVPITLRQPDSIWSGIREPDPGDEEPGFCYAKRFASKLNGMGGEHSCPEDQIFCVYLNSDRVVFEFGWDEVDPSDPLSPIQRDPNRFAKRNR